MNDQDGMDLAIHMANLALEAGARPFGTVILDEKGTLVGAAGGSEEPNDPTRHSEIVAIRNACLHRDGLLQDCTMYQTFEPCIGCCGFILHSKLSRIIVGSLREDLPTLFRQRNVSFEDLIQDASTPPEFFIFPRSSEERQRCRELFAAELVEASEGSESEDPDRNAEEEKATRVGS